MAQLQTSNIIHSCNDRNYDGTEVDSGIGISVRNGASAKISANIIWDCFISYRFGHSGVVRVMPLRIYQLQL